MQKVFGICEAKNRTEIDILLEARASGHKRVWQNVKADPGLGRVPAQKARNCKIEGRKRRITRKECQRLLNKLEMEGFMAQKKIVESRSHSTIAAATRPSDSGSLRRWW